MKIGNFLFELSVILMLGLIIINTNNATLDLVDWICLLSVSAFGIIGSEMKNLRRD